MLRGRLQRINQVLENEQIEKIKVCARNYRRGSNPESLKLELGIK